MQQRIGQRISKNKGMMYIYQNSSDAFKGFPFARSLTNIVFAKRFNIF